MVFMNDFFFYFLEKLIKKNPEEEKNMQNYPACKELMGSIQVLGFPSFDK